MNTNIVQDKASFARPPSKLWLSGFGIWAPYLWLGWTDGHNLSLPSAVPWQTMYLCMAVALVAFSLSRLTAGGIKSSVSERSGVTLVLDWCCSFIMMATTIITALASNFNLDGTVVVIATVLGGIALGWTYARWGVFYSQVESRQAVVFIFVASIFWSLIDVLLSILPLVVCCAFVSLTPFFAMFMLRRSWGKLPKTPAPARRFASENLIAMWKVWVVILAVSLVTSTFIASGAALPQISVPVFAVMNLCIVVVVGCIIVIWALKTNIPFDFPFLWRLFTFVLAGGLVLAAIAPDSIFVTVFFRAVPGILIPTTWLTVCDIAHRSGPQRCTVIGLGLGAYSLSSFLGVVVVGSFSGDVDIKIVSTVLLFLLFIVSGLCLETRDPDTRRIFEDMNDPLISSSESSTIEDRCALIGWQYGLTQREVEIMKLVCKGRPRSFVAEALFLSENTVKSHVSHIYSKLGIHSKKELQNLIDS